MDAISAPPNESQDTIRSAAGRPPFAPTSEQRHLVELARANGVPVKTIARLLGVNLRTLTRHFRQELADGRDRVVSALGAVVLNAALAGDWRAAIAWLSRHGGPEWRKTEGHLHAGLPGGEPIRVSTGRVTIVELPDNHRTDISPDEIAAEGNDADPGPL
jgi:hypothetical protein